MGSKLKVFGGQNNNLDGAKPYWEINQIKNNKIKYNTENTAGCLGYTQKQNRKKLKLQAALVGTSHAGPSGRPGHGFWPVKY